MQLRGVCSLGVLGVLFACEPKAPAESVSDAGTSGDASTGSSTSSTGEPTPTSSGSLSGGTDEPAPTTTDAPQDGCPQGQPGLSPLWAQPLTPQVPGAEVLLAAQLGRLGDGRLAIAALVRHAQASTFAPAVLWIAADGSSQDLAIGEVFAGQDLSTRALRVDADDSVVLVGDQMVDDGHAGWIARFAPGGAEVSRATISPAGLDQPRALALADAAIVLGFRRADHEARIARVDVATGAPQWELALPTTSIIAEPRVAIGPDDAIVAARGAWSNSAAPDFRVWRIDPQGAIAWERELPTAALGTGKLGGLEVTPDGRIVLLANREGLDARVVAIALDAADGATQWELDVAVSDADGDPRGFGAVVDAGSLAIPIGRGPAIEAGGRADPMTAALHVVTFAGAPGSVTPLPLAGLPDGNARFAPVRGACGELIVLHADDPQQWLGAFAP